MVAKPSNLFELAKKIELFAGGDDCGVIDSCPTWSGQQFEFIQKIRAPFGGCGVSCNIIRQRKMPYEKVLKENRGSEVAVGNMREVNND